MPKVRTKVASFRSLLATGSSRAIRGAISRRVRKTAAVLRGSSAEISPEQKAIYHSVTGAGKSRVIRDFFNVGRVDRDWIHEFLSARVARNLAKRGA